MLLVTALASGPAPSAQSPPRPAVRITQLPQLRYNTWPADVNGDGRTDLVGAMSIGMGLNVVVKIGRGDGTFGADRMLNIDAAPIAVGDFNGDGRIDIVVSGVAILPGNGNGTFGAARAVTGPPARMSEVEEAITADFNGDGHRDLGVLTFDGIDIYPGNGDFTFQPKMSLPGGANGNTPIRAFVGDFNGDGRRDIAAVLQVSAIEVFLNRGGLLFDASTIVLPPPATNMADITAGDLNRDGRQDLVALSSTDGTPEGTNGRFFVALGNANGTFQAPVDRSTGTSGSATVVVGDFNGDALTDVAFGNRVLQGTLPEQRYWDNVTILPGRGNATFASPADFYLDSVIDSDLYRTAHDTLNTSDVNGDRRTDLIASRGAILLNVPATANRAPTAVTGPDQMVRGGNEACFEVHIADADHDLLSVTWTDASGRVLGRAPAWCATFTESTTITATVTDGRGGLVRDSLFVFVPPGEPVPSLSVSEPDAGETVSATGPFTIEWRTSRDVADPRLDRFDLFSSSDNGRTWTAIPGCSNLPSTIEHCVWNAPGPLGTRARVRVVASDAGTLSAFAVSERFSIVAGPRTSLPDGWRGIDEGGPAVAGDTTFDGATFTVRGSGADIWGTKDEFHFASKQSPGDSFDFIARVVSVQNVNQWTKAGLMIRGDGGEELAHASVFVTPTTAKGTSVQVRTDFGGDTRQLARVPVTAPVWLRMRRTPTAVEFAYRKTLTDPWTTLATTPFDASSGGERVGLAVSSHVDGRLATARFDNVSAAVHPFWSNLDVGAVGVAGREIPDPDITRTTLEGSGADIWGTADAFHYRVTVTEGDHTLTARVRSIENTHRWAKAGVMFRGGSGPGGPHVMVVVSPGRGVAMQYRATLGGISANVALAPGVAPRWLRLARAGNTLTGYWSTNGTTWNRLGSIAVRLGEEDTAAGLVVTSHNNATLATAAFDEIALQP